MRGVIAALEKIFSSARRCSCFSLVNNGSQHSKRGPKSQLERQLEAIATLPRNQQQKILAVVEAMIAHQLTR